MQVMGGATAICNRKMASCLYFAHLSKKETVDGVSSSRTEGIEKNSFLRRTWRSQVLEPVSTQKREGKWENPCGGARTGASNGE